jgi:hypothetical protein
LLVFTNSCGSKSEDPVVEPDRFGSVTGFVYLEGTNKRLSDVIVTIDGRADTTLSGGSTGRYTIDSILVGRHTLTATRDEYHMFSVEIDVPEFLVYNIDLQIAIDVGNLRGFVWHPKEQYVGSAVITVGDGSSTYSKPDGSYEILNVPVGEQVITCDMFSFHPYEDTVVISESSNEFEIVLSKTFNDTIPISFDATVGWSSLNSGSANENRGWESKLSILYSMEGGENIVNRIFIGLPSLPEFVDVSVLEFATLVLAEAVSEGISADAMRDPPSLVARRVLEPWLEMNITWITMPDIDMSEEFAEIVWQTAHYWHAHIDLMKAYTDGIDPTHGIRIAALSDEKGRLTYESASFYSSEADDISRRIRPYVVMKYTI